MFSPVASKTATSEPKGIKGYRILPKFYPEPPSPMIPTIETPNHFSFMVHLAIASLETSVEHRNAVVRGDDKSNVTDFDPP